MIQPKTDKTILAIDPGIANTGWAYCARPDTMLWGTIKTLPGTPIGSRIRDVITYLSEAGHRAIKLDEVVVEDFVGRLGRETVWLIGAILYKFSPGVVKLVHPRKWVVDLWGKSKLGSEFYKKKAKELCKKNKWKPETQHEADALSLMWWASKQEV